MTSLKLYCAWFCPFAQRAWVALLEKNVPFQYIEHNPYKKKTAEFLALNPRGLVPVIVDNGQSIYESHICIEYVDEVGSPNVRLLPADPMKRAKVKLMCEYISREIIPLWYGMLLKQGKDVQEGIKAMLLENLKTLMTMKITDGPYLMGQEFGMADIMLVPFTVRFPVLEFYRGFKIPSEEEFSVLREWIKASHDRKHVKDTAPDKRRIIEVYKSYADGTANVRSKF
ncbi:hypothetical protein FSP39_020537 [Pinctada imbricata]|uniref:Glutathione S-transferase omega n=1 Tax=Pinctada imbricata TaxID=66713 RepID=A0AA88YA74_PINIB|nr:hypothetical protein FSP39_020537 [Pinctada imbricata]